MPRRNRAARRSLAIVGAIGVSAFAVFTSSAAMAAPGFGSGVSRSSIVLVADPVPTDVPVTPVPTVDPTPDPVPTPPVVDPSPTVVPTPEPTVTDPAVVPVTPDPGVTPETVVTPEPAVTSDAVVPADGGFVEQSTPTATPTAEPTPEPAPVVTATAAPLPAIELPFYPPPSAGVARDAFPFLLAGIAGGLVLLVGFGAYLFARWRVRRLRFRPVFGSSVGQRGGLGVFGVAGEFGAQSAAANAGFFSVAGVVTAVSTGLVAAGSAAGDSGAGRGAFAAGLPVRDVPAEKALGDAFELSLAPIHRPGAVRSASAFLLGLVPRRFASAEAGVGVAAFEVFEPVTVQSVSRPTSDLGLPPLRARRASALNFDLGLSAP